MKLAINTPGDQYEQEADRLADQVMRMPGPQRQRTCACGEKCSKCQAAQTSQAHAHLQFKRVQPAAARETAAPPIVHDGLASPGHPFDPATRRFMETRMGHDFSRVRIHTDATAAASARAVNAHAYTVGHDIVFAAGQYAPQSQSGLRLLAHELTHVIQQEGHARFSRRALEVGSPDARSEREADRPAEAIGQPPLPSLARATEPLVQRDLARPPRGPADAPATLTADQIQEAIAFNQNRFNDPYSIRTMRDLMGGDIDEGSGVVDEEFVLAVADWQAQHHLPQDGKVGHAVTRSMVLELAAESRTDPQALVDAIVLVIDSYRLPSHWALNEIRAGGGRRCCGTDGASDAETLGGPQDPDPAFRNQPISICICISRMLPKIFSDYDGFVRIIGHELVHVPQHQSGTRNDAINEFEAWFWEVCSQGRVPTLADSRRASQARIALSHFRLIPASLRTPQQVEKATKLQDLINRGGSGPC